MLKKWIIAKLMSADDIAYEDSFKVVGFGHTDDEKLESWLRLQAMLDSQTGLLWQAMMQKKAAALQGLLLNENDPALRMEWLYRCRQQTWVCAFPDYVKGKVKTLQEKIEKET